MKKKLLFICLFAHVFTARAFNIDFGLMFDDFDKIIDEQVNFLQEVRKSRTQARQGFGHTDVSIDVSQNYKDKQVLVTVKGITGDSCQAHLDQNNSTLTIATADEKITIESNNKSVSVHVIKEIKEPKKEDKKETEPSKTTEQKPEIKQQQVIGKFSTSTIRSLDFPIDLSKQTIEYNKPTETLVISFAYDETKMGKIVPVTIKS